MVVPLRGPSMEVSCIQCKTCPALHQRWRLFFMLVGAQRAAPRAYHAMPLQTQIIKQQKSDSKQSLYWQKFV